MCVCVCVCVCVWVCVGVCERARALEFVFCLGITVIGWLKLTIIALCTVSGTACMDMLT